MLNHRGQILRQVVDKYCEINRSSITAVAKRAGYNQSTIYRHFEKDDLPLHILRQYGKAMNYDFSKEIPEMIDDLNMVMEPNPPLYGKPLDLETCRGELERWKSKYIDLLERHNKLIEERLGLQR